MENTRLIHYKNVIYKVRVTCENEKYSSEKLWKIIDPVLRALLYAEARGRSLKRVKVTDATVQCSKKLWKTTKRLNFYQHGKIVDAYPYMFIFCVEISDACNIVREPDIGKAALRTKESSRHIILDDVDNSTVHEVETQKDSEQTVSKYVSTTGKSNETSHSMSQEANGTKHLLRSSQRKEGSSSASEAKVSGKRKSRTSVIQAGANKIAYKRAKTREKTKALKTTENISRLKKLDSEKRLSRDTNNSNSSYSVQPVEKNRLILPRRRDRHEIEVEQIEENMKLQTLARPTPVLPALMEQNISSLWKILQVVLTPIRLLTKR